MFELIGMIMCGIIGAYAISVLLITLIIWFYGYWEDKDDKSCVFQCRLDWENFVICFKVAALWPCISYAAFKKII